MLVNNELTVRMVYYDKQRASSWINNFAEAKQESNRLNIDNIERLHTKWVFVKFSNIVVKAVLDRQPLLGKGPQPDWLSNLAHSKLARSGQGLDIAASHDNYSRPQIGQMLNLILYVSLSYVSTAACALLHHARK